MKNRLIVLSACAVVAYLVLAVVACRIVPKKIADAERRLLGVRVAIANLEQDRIVLSQRIQAITDRTLKVGKTKDVEIEELLSDPDINHFALVYLGADWSVPRSAFIGAVAHSRSLISMQRKDRKGVSKRMDEREEERLEKVRLLENRKRSLTTQLASLSRWSISYDAKWREMIDVEKQLVLLRDWHDYNDTKSQKDYRTDQTDEAFATARAKTETEIFQLASEYEAKTVGALTRVMAEKLGELKVEANRPDHLRRLMSPFNIWPINAICEMPMEGKGEKQL